MARNGGVVTEFNICFPQRFSLLDSPSESSKMCKDDVIGPSLFCEIPESCLKSSMEFNNNKKMASLEGVTSDERMFSVIQQQSEHALDSCYLPAWENSNGLRTPSSDCSLDAASSEQNRNCDDSGSVAEVNPFLFKQPLVKEKRVGQIKGGSSDMSMPELIPLICVEDDDPVKVPEEEEKRVQESKLTDSPEMPKLIAFSSEEAFRIKKEPLDGDGKCRSSRVKLFGDDSVLESLADRSQQSGGRSPGGAASLQPHILLRRVSLEQCGGSSTPKERDCVPPNDDDSGDDSLRRGGRKNSSNEPPEIEEIEGVRFFQFRSKSDMEEFHEQDKAKAGEDEEMIVPTKTADITQIKGWRHKFFAPDAEFVPESEFQLPIALDTVRAAPSAAQGAVIETPSPPADQSKDPEPLKDIKPSMEDLMVLPRPSLNGPVPVIDLTTNNPRSAFESKILDDYLSNEPHLKVKYLEKINPNILPIPADSSILSLGKLFKPESQVTTLAALKLRNGIALMTAEEAKAAAERPQERRTPAPPPPVVRLPKDHASSDDADRSSDDDIPVARLKRQRVGKLVVPGRRVKRVKSDVSSDHSQRVVLRLTKGESKGYQVSEISAEKQEDDSSSSTTTSSSSSSSTSSSSSDDDDSMPIKIVPPGKLEILKHAMFMKVNEPQLLKEFLANLNRLGTSNDVAMLVQSNQSYFEKSPVLTEEACREAVEALVLNKDRSDFKKSPKKKLKAWQRYLPKKLNVSLQQKISKMTKTKASTSVDLLPSVSEKGPLMGKPIRRKKRLGGKAKLSKKGEAHIERERRAIRLPARYLDSAVLAAGTEWVSPVFDEQQAEENTNNNNKKQQLPTVARKQLLDVLEKIGTSKSAVAITQDASATTSECIVTKDPPSFARKLPKSPPKDGVPSKKAKLGNEAKKAKLLAAKEVDLTRDDDDDDPKKPKKVKDDVRKKMLAQKGMKCWRNQMKAIDAMVEDNRDPYPFPDCPYTHCTRTLVYDRIGKELGCTYDHKKMVQSLLCHEKLPNHIQGEEQPATTTTTEQPKGAVPLKGNLLLSQQVSGDKPQILLLVPDPSGKRPLLPKPAPGAAPLRWPQQPGGPPNALWFVQDGKPTRSVSAVSQRRRKSPLSVRLDDSDVDVEAEDFLFDAKAELERSAATDFTDEECELIFAAMMGDGEVALAGKSRSEVLLMRRSLERLRAKSAHFERARSCDEMLHMAQYVVRESTKLEKAYRCIKKVLRLRNIMLLKKANAMLSGSKDTDISVINKIKYELIRTLALEWETQKKERSKILSQFKSQPEPINAPPGKKQRIGVQPNLEMAKEGSKLDPHKNVQGKAADKGTSCVRKLFEPVVETEVLEEPHVQLRILEAPEGSVDIETQFSVVENEVVVQTQVESESTPIEKTKTLPQVSDVRNSDDEDLLIIDLSGERSKENSPMKAARRTSSESVNSSILDLSSGKQLKENSPVKSTEKAPEDSLKSNPIKPPLKKFPGLIPIYKSDFLNEERSLSGKGPNADCMKSDKSGPRGLANPIPENGRFKRTTISSTPDGWQESSLQHPLSSSYNRQGVDLVKGPSLSSDSNYTLPRRLLHSSSSVQHQVAPLTNAVPPEEITLDDSDDEAGIDYSKRTHNPPS